MSKTMVQKFRGILRVGKISKQTKEALEAKGYIVLHSK